MTNNATWCQNRGCICISSVRRTYGRIHSSFLQTSSHPDKYNNSVDRITSKEEEREDPRRELQSIFEYSGVSTFLQKLQCSHMQSSNSKIILHTELILLQEFSKKYYNYKAHPVSPRADYYKASSSDCFPCIQAFYMAESSSKHPRIGWIEEEF